MNWGDRRETSFFPLESVCLSQALALEDIARCGDEGAVDFGAEEGAGVAEVEGEEDFAAVGEGGNEDGLVFGGGEEERTFAG